MSRVVWIVEKLICMRCDVFVFAWFLDKYNVASFHHLRNDVCVECKCVKLCEEVKSKRVKVFQVHDVDVIRPC